MNITLTPRLRKFVQEKVKTGQFASPAEVIESALTLLRAEETLNPAEVEALRREVEVGLRQADRGEFVEFSAATIKARGRRVLGARKRVR